MKTLTLFFLTVALALGQGFGSYRPLGEHPFIVQFAPGVILFSGNGVSVMQLAPGYYIQSGGARVITNQHYATVAEMETNGSRFFFRRPMQMPPYR